MIGRESGVYFIGGGRSITQLLMTASKMIISNSITIRGHHNNGHTTLGIQRGVPVMTGNGKRVLSVNLPIMDCAQQVAASALFRTIAYELRRWVRVLA